MFEKRKRFRKSIMLTNGMYKSTYTTYINSKNMSKI